MGVVVCQVIGDARDAAVQVAAAELLSGDDLPGRGPHQRGAAQEDGPLVAHDDRLVAHRRHVRAARRAGSQHRRHLRDARRGQLRLVVEDPPEMLAVGEHLVLHRQERAAGVHQRHRGQPVLQRHGLRAQVLLHRHRVVGAALDGGVVGDDDALPAADPADPGDDARGGRLVVVHAVRGKGRDLQERRAGVQQVVDALARQQLAAGGVLGARRLAAADRGGGQSSAAGPGQSAALCAALARNPSSAR